MQRLRVWALGGVMGLWMLLGCTSRPVVQDDGMAALRTLDGASWSFAEHRGSWVLVHYWSFDCGYCRQEVPGLNQWAQSHPDVEVVGVNPLVHDEAALRTMVEQWHIQYPVLLDDPSPRLQTGHLVGLPATVVVDPQGRVQPVVYGPVSVQRLSELGPG